MNYELNTSIFSQLGAVRNAVENGKRHRFFFGLDLDRDSCAVAVIIDGDTPHYYGKLTRQRVLEIVGALRELDFEVALAQEACGMGYDFHRDLEALGAKSVVVAPEPSGRRKTDKMDARKLARKLYDMLVNEAKDALRCVRVPSEEEHQRRAVSRHRHQLRKEVTRMAAMGLSLLHDHGRLEVKDRWWGPRNWPKLREQLETTGTGLWLVEMLAPLQETILNLKGREKQLRQAVVETNLGDEQKCHQNMAPTPKGFGEITRAEARAEICDWNRFNNRKEVGSFGGLCPSEYSSGAKRTLGSIDRIGSPRLRAIFVEAAWRMVRWQPEYRGVRKFAHVLAKGAKATRAARKKAIVAVARMLMIDMWRIETRRCDLEQLGFVRPEGNGN
jgi:transposase